MKIREPDVGECFRQLNEVSEEIRSGPLPPSRVRIDSKIEDQSKVKDKIFNPKLKMKLHHLIHIVCTF